MNVNVPNILSFLRIILIPALVAGFYLPAELSRIIASSIFLLACITDIFDGYVARTFNQTTKLGAFLDPVADKLIVAVALVLIVGELQGAYLAIPAAVIVGREIMVSALREWMAELGKRTSVAVSFVGKIKTIAQMASIVSFLLYKPGDVLTFFVLGLILLYIAALLTLWSMVMYIRAAWPDLKNNE